MSQHELHSETIETYIIKVMYNRPNTIVEISQSLRPSDFFFAPMRYLFTAIKKTSLKGDVTAEGIMTLLENENKEAYKTLKNIGGATAIEMQFRDDTLPNSPAVKDQMEVMKSLSYRRNALDIADKMKNFVTSNVDTDNNKQFSDVNDLDDRIKELVYGLADNISSSDEVEVIGKSVEAVRRMIKNKDVNGIDIGFIFPKINRLIKRLRNGALYIFGAPEKVGKSSFMLHIAWLVADKLEIPVAYGDTEMTTEEQLLRICSKISGVAEDKIIEDDLNQEQRERVENAWERIEKVPFFHFNANELTNNELESKVKLLQLKHGVRLFVYDYVKVQAHEVEKGRLDMIMAAKIDTLKEKIAKNCDIPVITSGQMYEIDNSKAGEAQGKNKHKFAETSHFTKLGDVICRLDKTDPKDPSQFGTHYLELIMGRKVRSNDVGKKVELNFIMENHQIREL